MSLEEIRKSLNAQGQRIKFLRDKIAKINLLPFAKKAEVNKNTLSCWENGNLVRPLLPKNIEKLIKAFKHYQIEVDEHWLRAGEGELPKHKGQTIQYENIYLPLTETQPVIADTQIMTSTAIKENTIDLSQSFLNEIKLFSDINHAVVTKIDHNGFVPMIEKGDWVGGTWQDSSMLIEEKICIFELQPGLLHVAKVSMGSKKGLFKLTYLNPDLSSALKHFQIQEFSLTKIAPVIRFWR